MAIQVGPIVEAEGDFSYTIYKQDENCTAQCHVKIIAAKV